MNTQVDNAVTITLPSGHLVLVDAADYDMLSAYHWCLTGKVYVGARINKKFVYMHRFLLDAPASLDVDHLNRNPLDNRRSNLRLCTTSQNAQNKQGNRNTTSQYKGVCWSVTARKWAASIKINKQIKHLGLFINEADAARAYNEAAQSFGEFALLNEVAA